MERTRTFALLAASFLLLTGALHATAATLDQIGARGTLLLGYVAEARPFSYRDEVGKPAGYAVALCERVAEAVKTDLTMPQLRIEFVQVPGDAASRRWPRAGSTSCARAARRRWSAASWSRSRSPCFSAASALMREDAPVRVRRLLSRTARAVPAALARIARAGAARPGLRRGRGTTTEAWAAERLDEFDIAAGLQTVDDFETGVQQVVARRADVLFGDRAILLSTAARSAAAGDLIVLDRHFTHDAPGLGLPRGDEGFRLLVDRALSQLYRSGEIAAIYTRYFGKPAEQTLRFFQASALAE
jgi:ABC-type amino acid transport substrate-binding protein